MALTYPSPGPGVYRWVIEIAGLARQVGDFDNDNQSIRPMAMSTGTVQGASTRCDLYVPALVREGVSLGEQSCNPLTGEYTTSTLEFSVTLDDNRWPEIGRFFLTPNAARAPFALSTEDFDANETTLSVQTVSGAPASDYTGAIVEPVLYWRRESFRIKTVKDDASGAATIEIIDLTPDPNYDDPTYGGDVTRSANGAVGSPSNIGTLREDYLVRTGVDDVPPVPDDRLFLYSPFVAGREVTLYRTDGVNTEQIFWRGFIDGDPIVDDSGTTITIRAVDILHALRKRKFNTNPVVWIVKDCTQYAPDDDFRFFTLNSSTLEGVSRADVLERSVWLDPQAVGATTPIMSVLQVRKCGIVSRDYTSYIADTNGIRTYAGRCFPKSVFGGEILPALGDFGSFVGAKVFELLVSDPMNSASPVMGGETLTPENHPYWCDDLPDPSAPGSTVSGIIFHPLHFVLAHLSQLTCPNLPDQWKIKIQGQFVDTVGIIELARTTFAYITEWPGVVAGKDGKAVNALEWLEKTFLRPLAAGFAMQRANAQNEGSSAYRVTVRTLVSVATGLDVTISASELLQGRSARVATGMTTDAVIASCGLGLSDIPRVNVVGDEVYQTSFFPYSSTQYSIEDVGLVHPDEPAAVALVQTVAFQFFRRVLQTLATLFRYPLTVIPRGSTFGAPVHAGDIIYLEDVGGRSETTGLVETVTKPAFVMTRSVDLNGALSQKISLLVLPYSVRRIGPTATATTASTTTKFNAENAVWIQLVDGSGEYRPDPTQTVTRDVECFAVGQRVRVVSAALEPITEATTITVIDASSSPNQITVSPAFTLIGGGFTHTPVAGELLVVCSQADADATSLGSLAFVGRDTYSI